MGEHGYYTREFLDSLADRLADYLLMTGRSIDKNFNCVSPDHEDSNPSMHFYGTTCFCFSCGARYDLFRFIGVDYNIPDFRGQVQKACELFNVSTKTDAMDLTANIRQRQQLKHEEKRHKADPPKRDYTKLFAYCRSRINETDYGIRRGLSKEIIEKAGLGFHPRFQVNKDGETWPIMIIPVDDNHFVARNTDPDADKNSRFHVSSGGREIYTRFSDVENSDKPTWIVEGEIDAISIADCGSSAIAIGSATNVPKILRYFKEHIPKAPLILALDQDEAGRAAQEHLASELSEAGIKFITSRVTGYKDANEFLQKDRDGLHQFLRREQLSATLRMGISR